MTRHLLLALVAVVVALAAAAPAATAAPKWMTCNWLYLQKPSEPFPGVHPPSILMTPKDARGKPPAAGARPETVTTSDAGTIARAAGPQMCPNTFGGDVIVAEGVGCRRARDLVRTWAVRTRRTGKPNRTVHRYRCRMTVSQIEGETMHCRRAGRSVRWYVNLPR